jgi:high affinity sulfate transporter 1
MSPVTETLPGYGRRLLRKDLLAGLTVAALALPSGMAYAELAGLSPVAGLYALLLPTVAYVMLGSSRQLIVGPEGSIAALVGASVAPLAVSGSDEYADLAALLAIMVGLIFVAARLIRLGWIADYFSRAVLTGYIHGVAIYLVIAQLGKLTGVPITAQDPIPQLVQFVQEVDLISWPTVVVSSLCLTALALFRRFAPRWPGPLIVVIVATLASATLDLAAEGIAIVGPIPAGLPSIDIPRAPAGDILALLPAAIGIFLVSFADEILTARSFAGKHAQRVRVGQELSAMGLADVAAGITQGFPVGASGSRTAVNDQMGGRTQIAGLIGAAGIALVLVFFTEPMQYLPKATLGSVIVVAAFGLVESKAWRMLARTARAEVVIAAITTIGVVTVGVLWALAIAVALSIVDVVRRSASPHDAVLGWVERLGRYGDVRLHPSARVVPGVVVYRLDDRLFFANASYVKGRIAEAIEGAQAPVRSLVFDAEAMAYVDATGLAALEEIHARLERDGIGLVIARMKSAAYTTLDETGLVETIGRDRFYPTVRDAVAAVLDR